MRILQTLCLSILLLVVAIESQAKKVTLKCSRGYSVNITFKIWYPTDPSSFLSFTMNCPPTAVIDIPDGYDGISVDAGDGTMTAPDGTQTDLQLPSPVDNSPLGSDLGVAPWPPNFPAHHSYIGTSTHWEEDPQAPPFIQDGELLLGEYEDGAIFPLTISVLDSRNNAPVEGVAVTILVPGGVIAASGTTDSNGRAVLNLAAGSNYQIKVDSAAYMPQVSDEFMVLGAHMWTMIMTPNAASRNQISILTWGLVVLSVLLLLLIFSTRRTRIP